MRTRGLVDQLAQVTRERDAKRAAVVRLQAELAAWPVPLTLEERQPEIVAELVLSVVEEQRDESRAKLAAAHAEITRLRAAVARKTPDDLTLV